MDNFCFEEARQTLSRLRSSESGLSPQEAQKRIAEKGKNVLQSGKKVGVVRLFFGQFKDFMTILLIVAAAVSGVIAYLSKDRNDLCDTFIILLIIFLNAVVGTVQQYRADKAVENLKKLSATFCKVRRDGKDYVVPCEDIAAGDVVILEEGDVVPADCRIISCNSLLCDESALTGESAGVEKNSDRIRENKVSLGNMKNMLFGSTYIVRGNCTAVVTAVGMDTEMGKIAGMLSGQKQVKTPLEKSLDRLGKIISAFVLAVTAVVFIAGLSVRSDGILKNFMTAVAVAVAAIPEGLPAVVTIIMAMGVQKMSSKGVIIRRLKSVETLGGCSVICTDKTGTLTENRLRVVRVAGAGGGAEMSAAVREKLLECMTACNGVKGQKGSYIGDPTEIALRIYADERGFATPFTRESEIPFTSERKMMTVFAEVGGRGFSFTKGAADVLIGRCTHVLKADGVRELTESDRREIAAETDAMSDDALRVLGFAYKPSTQATETGLIFIGLCGMQDAIRDGVAQAVQECRAAGVKTVMITGDHARTALSIARKCGIAESFSEVVTGDELDGLKGDELDRKIGSGRVFARVSPKHKKLIVDALQKSGSVVAMTGDGINDAPSVKSADIGISMGISGTDVTKSASDMIISDDNFATIVSAVREGRRLSENIKKTIRFFISTNLAEVLAILFASLFLFRHDFLLSTQLLWLNLITDSLPVLALGMEREERDIMARPPERAEKGIFSGLSLISMCFYGLYMTVATLGVFVVSLNLWGNAVASTATFMTLSFMELLQAFNIRSQRSSAFGKSFFSNKLLILTVALGVGVNVLLCVTPLRYAFSLSSLTGVQWAVCFGVALSLLVAGEIFKAVVRLCGKMKGRRIAPRPDSARSLKQA